MHHRDVQAYNVTQTYDSDPRLAHSHVTGSIPKEIGALVALTFLDLRQSSIEGTSNTLQKY